MQSAGWNEDNPVQAHTESAPRDQPRENPNFYLSFLLAPKDPWCSLHDGPAWNHSPGVVTRTHHPLVPHSRKVRPVPERGLEGSTPDKHGRKELCLEEKSPFTQEFKLHGSVKN